MSSEKVAGGYIAGSHHQGLDEKEETACNPYLAKNSYQINQQFLLQVLQHLIYEMTMPPDCQRVLWGSSFMCTALLHHHAFLTEQVLYGHLQNKHIHICVEGLNRMSWKKMEDCYINIRKFKKTQIYIYTHIYMRLR